MGMGDVCDVGHRTGESARNTWDTAVARRQCAKDRLDLFGCERGNFRCKRRVGKLWVGLEGRREGGGGGWGLGLGHAGHQRDGRRWSKLPPDKNPYTDHVVVLANFG